MRSHLFVPVNIAPYVCCTKSDTQLNYKYYYFNVAVSFRPIYEADISSDERGRGRQMFGPSACLQYSGTYATYNYSID